MAAFEELLKTARGITGYFAAFASIRKNSTEHATPTVIKTSTVGEVQSNDSPPMFRPSKVIRVTASSARLPSQSTALSPAQTGVLGLCTSRKRSRMTKLRPQIGRFMYLDDRESVCLHCMK